MRNVSTILCIDDNVLVLEIRKAVLESKGYRVFTAEKGRIGLGIMDRQPIDVAIVDYEMPEMDGGMVVRELQRKQPGIAILLLTGFPGKLPDWLLAVVDGFIAKGSSPEILLKEVERVTGVYSNRPAQVSQAADTSRKRVRHSHKLLQSSHQLICSSRQKLQHCAMSNSTLSARIPHARRWNSGRQNHPA